MTFVKKENPFPVLLIVHSLFVILKESRDKTGGLSFWGYFSLREQTSLYLSQDSFRRTGKYVLYRRTARKGVFFPGVQGGSVPDIGTEKGNLLVGQLLSFVSTKKRSYRSFKPSENGVYAFWVRISLKYAILARLGLYIFLGVCAIWLRNTI
ncbi:hypothetical protein QNI22_39665 [Cytophagaceae bacterium BD1B2-1]|uniref:Uncharacterized protein n=1 Tax=Xanthocytophaga agilis TaxID=3048010 RepID=A0AAE3RE10_9BACT|nr:hypothetical protein [Xanthocytophaga agilis]